MKKLKHFLATPIKNGYSPVCTDKPTSKVVLGLGALTGSGLNLTQVKWVPESNTQADKFPIEPGDFLVSRSNTLDKVGRAALYRGGLSNCSYPDLMMKFRVDEGKIIPDFMELILQSAPARKHFMRCASGTSSTMAKITKSVVESLRVPDISLSRQKEIVNIISVWQKAIEKSEALIEAKETQFNSILQRLMIRKNHWEPCKFKDVFAERVERQGKSDLVISSVGVNGLRNRDEVYSKELAKDYSKNKVVKKNDIAFGLARDSIVFGINTQDINCSVSPAYKVFNIINCDVDFLGHYLKAANRRLSQKYLIISARQGKSIDFKGFLDQEFFLPSFKEQNEIANTLNLANREIILLKKVLEKYRIQKYGLMQKLLTGEWQVGSSQHLSEETYQEASA